MISGTPTVAGTASFTITAQDFAGETAHQNYSVTISSTPLALSPSTLPGWDINQPGYNQTVVASGGTSPYTYSVTTGALPLGLSLNSTTGVISGTPTAAGTASFTITAQDFAGETAHENYSVTITSTPLRSARPRYLAGTSINPVITRRSWPVAEPAPTPTASPPARSRLACRSIARLA